MSTYEYKALPDPRKCMRLLKLLTTSDPLSYTWGQQDASCSIWLRDAGYSAWKPFSIRPNLESCLKQLRNREARILWIDAICINQTDNVEKGHQVATMDLVYQS
ncbi:uncharacterized protein CLUP02_16649 [Colletotrichum lupini]|uniref:Heterokaryon incompatibility domain-containing protein n=1 Tax=Colletotrichum lupini TaxID=145971 RepID=A0A9Q8WQC8_9PEZI|nr:uncharacterized protein CLUP02_16649 [Colletotrichum lupini]UQC91115.1 hypothetical protein CLUP02_16649 [Colletotrichum lupini]